MKRTCTVCKIEKDTDNGDFQIRKTPKGTLYFRTECRGCRTKYSKAYYKNNSEKIIQQNCENKKNNRGRVNSRIKERKLTDLSFKVGSNIRSLIKITIKRNGGKKGGESCLKYLSYSLNELKDHLEKRFEPWMTWENWSTYDPKTWNDNDQTTWTWQLDHITPQSDLTYTSMSDANFKKCWALENLRPLSAKQNIIDGPTRIRHKRVD